MRTFVAIVSLSALAILIAPARAQDAAAGERLFVKCRACHQVGEGARNLVGPQLNGIVGRPAASIDKYAYSPAMKGSGLTWDEETLAAYLRDPRGKVPRNRMVFPGLKKDSEIADLIAYLKRFDADGARR
ncbi:MAG: c-type cytochrome [Pseudochelatococcus sp.]|jgi:cytochrome c|uniref:c-type cytochrome n=1 Tax=Pseudochelatococcus sp. TaxID=2020869 RepID=UPI003D8EB46A